jgi:DNA modification methylase
VQEFIEFFTKHGVWVLDPFLGSGSTLLAARMSGRNAVGLDVNPRYVSMSKKRLATLPNHDGTKQIVLKGDSRHLQEILEENGIGPVDFCITSPPYWNQLKRASMRQRDRHLKGWDTVYSKNRNDIGNISDYEKFLDAETEVFDQVYRVLKLNGYLVVVTNNVFYNGRLYPLAFDTFKRLAKQWIPKDEKIWLHDDKRLLPLGIYNAWVGNRSHQYCLIFRKET